MNILQAMKDALKTMDILSGYILNERCGCGHAHTAKSQRKLDKLEPIESKLNNDIYHLRAAIKEMEKAEPIYQVWRSTDSCGEFYSWDDCDEYDYIHEKDPDSKRILYLHVPITTAEIGRLME